MDINTTLLAARLNLELSCLIVPVSKQQTGANKQVFVSSNLSSLTHRDHTEALLSSNHLTDDITLQNADRWAGPRIKTLLTDQRTRHIFAL
jgi:hypothetical protein